MPRHQAKTALSRRHFVKSMAGLGVLTSVGAGAYLWGRPQHPATGFSTGSKADPATEFFYDVSVQPLFCSSTPQFQSQIHLQGNCSDSGLQSIATPYQNQTTMAFYNPSGEELWRTQTELMPLTSLRPEIPQDLGWCSVVSVQAVDARSGLSPNIEVGQFFETTSRQGRDSHHGLLWRPWPQSYQCIQAPAAGQSMLMGVMNPLGRASTYELTVRDSNGKVAFRFDGKLAGCATDYWVMGEGIEAPESARRLKLEGGQSFVMHIQSEANVTFPISSWHQSENRGFTMSHGGYALDEKIALEYSTKSATTGDSKLGLAMANDRQESAFVDLAFTGEATEWGIEEASKIVIPNLLGKPQRIEMQLQDQHGKVLTWVEELLPFSAHTVDLAKHREFAAGQSLGLRLKTKQAMYPISLIKTFNRGSEGLQSVQHARPDDRIYLDQDFKLKARSLGGLESENWISNGPWSADRTWRLLVHNLSASEILSGEVQYLGPQGLVARQSFSSIQALGSQVIELLPAAQIESAEALRIVSDTAVLRASLHEMWDGILASSAHGTSKLKFAGLVREAPPLLRTRSS